MTIDRLNERIAMKKRLDHLVRLQKSDPVTASWFDESITELMAGLRQMEGQA